MKLTGMSFQEIDPEDHATLDALAPGAEAAGGKTLADMIFDKMQGGAVSQGLDDDGKWNTFAAWKKADLVFRT